MKSLTKKQLDIFRYIQNFLSANNYSPSFQEIKKHFGLSSSATVHKHIQALKRKGVVGYEQKRARSLTLTETGENKPEARREKEIPFIGYISAGLPIELFAQSKVVCVPDYLIHILESTYALKVKGDSLREELIADGDLLILEARQNAFAGEVIVAMINQHDTVVKRYYPESEFARLVSCDQHLQPIILRNDDIAIQGVITGIIRQY